MIKIQHKCECGAELEIEVENGESRKSVCLECGDPYVVSAHIASDLDSKKTYRNEAWLREEYSSKVRSMASIAKECAVSPMTIFKWLRTHDIETRTTGRKK